ncbi:MAG: glycerophosphodiester phosphodiesterase [Actinomycetota bacterium]|nr:glycerophosphodiester phosphodiesterase [Actinomycetota bacterium]
MSARSPFAERQAGELPFVWAHRGASALAPENTIAAFALAGELGADGIELDVQLDADGTAVVCHEPHLFATPDGLHLRDPGGGRPVAVAHLDTATLTSGVVFPDGSRHRIARFDEALEAIPAAMWLDVELKAGGAYDPRLSEAVAGALAARGERTLFSSFDHVVLAELAHLAPQIPRAVLCDARLVDPSVVLAPLGSTMLNLRRANCTASDVTAWRAAGIAVCLYGAEVTFDLAEVCGWPVSGLFLDDPRLEAHLAER